MASIDYKLEGTVFDIQRFSLHDGPGIRTIVFLKGCPLSCPWCSNPESQKLKPEVLFNSDQCMECGKCYEVCKHNAIDNKLPKRVDRNNCIGCGECTNVCMASALTLKGEKMSIEQLINILKKDSITYRKSNGGITLSGGEPLVQCKFATELLKACKSQGWHTAIETTGYCEEEVINSVFPYVDLTLLDIKSIDDQTHKKYMGVSNEKILRNAKLIAELSQVIVRVPTIPSINATESDFAKIAEFARQLHHVDTVNILPYHVYGDNKYGLLGREYPMDSSIKPLEPEEVIPFKQIVEKTGLKCVVNGLD